MSLPVLGHVLAMFLAVAISYGTITLLWAAARARDVDALRGIIRTIQRLRIAIPVAYMAGIVLGIVSIFTVGFDPLARWLVIAYVLTIIAIGSANAVVGRWLDRVSTELAASAGSTVPSAFTDRRAVFLLAADAAVIAAIIADMVLKPFA